MNDDRTDLEVFQFGLAQDAENFRAERIVPALCLPETQSAGQVGRIG
jgi:hypothetical protein